MEKTCPKCQTVAGDALQCPNCLLIFSKYEEVTRFKAKVFLNRGRPVEKEGAQLLIHESYRARLLAFPIAVLISFLVNKTFLRHLLSYFSVWCHELGHALMSWLSGIKATPLSFGPYGFTAHSDPDRSLVVFCSFVFLMFVLFGYGQRQRSPFLKYLASVLFLACMFFTWGLHPYRRDELIISAGFAGELILGTLLGLSFFYRLPEKLHWQHFTRWPILFIGTFTLISSTGRWFDSWRKKNLLVFGSNYSEDAFFGVPGDLYRLSHDYNWPLDQFFTVYLSLAVIGWLLLLLQYGYVVKKHG